MPRPRITTLIAEGTRWCPLTVVTGPAGAGKTVALSLWAAAGPGLVAWVSVDEFHNRPGVFWSYVLAALRRSGVAVPGASPAAGRWRAVDDRLVLQLAAALAGQDPPVALVLDDLHLLTDVKVLKELDFVLRNAGAGLRLAIASRMDPMFALHRYRLAGQLAEVRAGDLAFRSAEAALLLAQHGVTLTADLRECLVRRTEGWAAGLRLAAISLATHPEPERFVTELAAEDSALTGYLVAEVLNAQPAAVRDVLLCTSILDDVSADAAIELAGNDHAGGIVADLARANAFLRPLGGGRYRYHALFGEVLRLKLRREYPDRMAGLHRRAARWYARNGLLADAVRHAVRAGDWQLAANLVIDDLAVGQILEADGTQTLAAEFAGMPAGRTWTEPQPYLISAALALSAGRHESCAAALDAADGILACVPGGQRVGSRLASALIRLGACLRTGDVTAAAEAADRAEALADQIPRAKLARHPDIRALVLSGRGAVELWSGHLDQAASALQAGADAQSTAAFGSQDKPAGYPGLGLLALAEAMRGRLARAAQVVAEQGPGLDLDPAALVALGWVHLERNEVRQARKDLRQTEAVLGASPDKLIEAMAYLVDAGGALAEGRAWVSAQIIDASLSAGPVPAWLDQRLSLLQSRAYAAAGDFQAALAAAHRGQPEASSEAMVTLAHAWVTAGDTGSARRALELPLANLDRMPDRVRVQAWLVDARLSYLSGNYERGHRSLASALRLAEPEQLRLPFVLERNWIGPVLRHDAELAGTYRRLLVPALRHEGLSAPQPATERPGPLVVEPLTRREREVLVHVAGMLTMAEVAAEMSISANTVKTHLRNIYHKLGVEHRGQAVRRARQLEFI